MTEPWQEINTWRELRAHLTWLESADIWLHARHLTWIAKVTGVCWLMDRGLDRMERESL